MKKSKTKICVFTAARSDYFILKPLIKKLSKEEYWELLLVSGSMHHKLDFGNTNSLIEKDGFKISSHISSSSNGISNKDVVFSMGEELKILSVELDKLKPDMCIVLGDRYEVITFALACHIFRIPIIHIHGGELSAGSFDEGNRHAITKLSSLHFPSTEKYRKRIIQLGENPSTVLNFGALAVENIKSLTLTSHQEIQKHLKTKLREKFLLVTLHPETFKKIDDEENALNLAEILKLYKEYDIVWTYSNADPSGNNINKILRNLHGFYVVKNLGDFYINVMAKASAVIGNSSSGLIEAPVLGTPTVNIGDRQEGRHRCKSVFDASWSKSDIKKMIAKALSWVKPLEIDHPYGDGNTSSKIIEAIFKHEFSEKKIFLDLEYKI